MRYPLLSAGVFKNIPIMPCTTQPTVISGGARYWTRYIVICRRSAPSRSITSCKTKRNAVQIQTNKEPLHLTAHIDVTNLVLRTSQSVRRVYLRLKRRQLSSAATRRPTTSAVLPTNIPPYPSTPARTKAAPQHGSSSNSGLLPVAIAAQ